MSDIATTKRQREILAHSINLEARVRCRLGRKLRDRADALKVSSDRHRNYYCTSVGGPDDAEITKLCEMGLMRKGPTINDGRAFYAFVTEAGIAEIMPV